MDTELHYLLFDQLKDIFSQVFFTWNHIYILWNLNYNNKNNFLSKFRIFRTEKKVM